MSLRNARFRQPVIALALILVGALLAASAPASVVADEHEPFQDIEEFQPVSVDRDMLTEMEAVVDEMDPMVLFMVYMQIQELGEFETDLSEDSIRIVDSIDEVNDHIDGSLAVPDELPSGLESENAMYATGDSGYASYTFDVQIAHQISELLELPTDWLPDPEDQSEATISVQVPESGMVAWMGSRDRLIAGQVGMPELELPEDLDLEALREAILDDPRLPDDLVDELDAIDDWDTTLPVPVPEGAEYEDVTVEGEPGFQLSMAGKGSVIVWISDDGLSFVAGTYDGDELMDVADSIGGSSDLESRIDPAALSFSLTP